MVCPPNKTFRSARGRRGSVSHEYSAGRIFQSAPLRAVFFVGTRLRYGSAAVVVGIPRCRADPSRPMEFMHRVRDSFSCATMSLPGAPVSRIFPCIVIYTMQLVIELLVAGQDR